MSMGAEKYSEEKVCFSEKLLGELVRVKGTDWEGGKVNFVGRIDSVTGPELRIEKIKDNLYYSFHIEDFRPDMISDNEYTMHLFVETEALEF